MEPQDADQQAKLARLMALGHAALGLPPPDARTGGGRGGGGGGETRPPPLSELAALKLDKILVSQSGSESCGGTPSSGSGAGGRPLAPAAGEPKEEAMCSTDSADSAASDVTRGTFMAEGGLFPGKTLFEFRTSSEALQKGASSLTLYSDSFDSEDSERSCEREDELGGDERAEAEQQERWEEERGRGDERAADGAGHGPLL